MTDPWAITITPEPGTENATIKTTDGQEFTVKGLAVFADGGDGHLFVYTWNSPIIAASGCVRACCEAIRQGNRTVVAFYRAMLSMFAQATSLPPTSISAEDLIRKWDAQEVYNSVKELEKKSN
jgi:hypothetical protein